MSSIFSTPLQQQSFCLKWNNYQSNVTSTFKELLADEDFVDITLTAEGRALKAHKVVLSACSPYFREILKGISSWQHPVIVLKEVPFTDLQGIVEFIYHGEVSVLQEELTSFLKTAQILRVKGLTEDTGTNNNEPSEVLRKKKHHTRKSKHPTRAFPSGLNPKRLCVDQEDSNSFSTNNNSDDESSEKKPAKSDTQKDLNSAKSEEEEEIDDVEEDADEEEEEAPPYGMNPQESPIGGLSMPCDPHEEMEEKRRRQQAMMTGGDISVAGLDANALTQTLGFSNMLKLSNTDGSNASAITSAMANVLAGLQKSPGLDPTYLGIPGDVSPPINPLDANSPKKTCPYCHQQLSWHALSRHIRDMHRAKTGIVTCKYCLKTFRNKNSLGCHMWRFHKDMREKDQAAQASSTSSPQIQPSLNPPVPSNSSDPDYKFNLSQDIPALPVIPHQKADTAPKSD